MAHAPHLYLPPPWTGPTVGLAEGHHHHLRKVIRLRDGAALSYTDGEGVVGSGILEGDSVVRGAEHAVDRPKPFVALAVALLKSAERTRFVVEKLAELGIDELVWAKTRFGQGSPPREEKAVAWAHGALEQSRGAFAMRLRGPVPASGLGGEVWAAVPGAPPPPPLGGPLTILVGPEGGLADDDLPPDSRPVGLGKRVLRTETAAVAVAARLVAERV